MKQARYRIIFEDPVLLSRAAGDSNTVATFDYIPGTSILGLFASLYLDANGRTAGEEFYSIFFRDNITFTNAYLNACNTKYQPVPLSLQSDRNDLYLVHDLLFSDAGNTSPISGFCSMAGGVFTRAEIKKTLHFHQERDRDKGFSKKGVIFNYQSMDKGQSFEGCIFGKEEYIDRLTVLVKDGAPLYLGRSKTAQYGRISMEIYSQDGVPETCVGINLAGREDVVMTMLSDTILYNENGFSEVSISLVEKAVGSKVKNSFIRKDIFENFVSVWRARKPMENVFSMGSCFLLEKVPENYRQMEASGLGERRSEGFGRVVFGLQSREKYTLSTSTEIPSCVKPTKLAVRILHKFVEDAIRESIVLNAYEDADRFKNKPVSNSLVSKLAGFVYLEKPFETSLGQLREIAAKQVENCNNGSETLKDFLCNAGDKVTRHMKTSLNRISQKLVTEAVFNPDDKKLCKSMERLYLKSFFTQLRRSNKDKGEK